MAPRTSSRIKAPAKTPNKTDNQTLSESNKSAGPKTRRTATKVKEESPATTTTTTTRASKLEEAFAKTPVPKRKAEPEPEQQDDQPIESKTTTTTAKKRKTTKTAKEEDTMPLAERTAISSLKKAMYIGAHVSAAGGVNNAVTNALQIGANSFALFLKSQRKWSNPPIQPSARDLFISQCKHHHYDQNSHALPHGSYLVNLAQADAAKADQAYDSFVDDLKRCESLGIRLYNFHPGSTGGGDRDEAISRIAAQLNKAHAATDSVVTVLENMAGSGNVIGATWEDLRDIIAQVEEKSRVGVCIDTCHAFAAGHDLRTPEVFQETFQAFDKVVGREYLKAFHLNDSKAPFGSNRDLHANIGTGFLGLRAFHSIMNDDSFRGMPMVLETPIDRPDGKGEDKGVWAEEIKLLESLIGMDPDGDEFKGLEKKLWERGEGERSKIQSQVDKKNEKKAKVTKRKKKSADSDESD